MEGVHHYSYGIYYKDMQIEKDIDLIYSGASMIKPFILDIITHNIYIKENLDGLRHILCKVFTNHKEMGCCNIGVLL